MTRSRPIWRPDERTIKRSNLTAFLRSVGIANYRTLEKKAADDPDWFWNALIAFLDIRFARPYSKVRDTSDGKPWVRWCIGGETNLILSGLDKHAAGPIAQKPAVIWEGERGDVVEWSYAELSDLTSKVCAGLRSLGLKKGDVVGLYMPMIPQTAAAFLAIVKAGAIVLPLFSGYGADAVASRLRDANAKYVFTVDGHWRRGRCILMKPVLDEAAEDVPSLRGVVVVNHVGEPVEMKLERDVWWNDLVADQDATAATEIVDASAPAMIVYTSGTTGRPKGTVHTHCGFVTKTAQDYQLYFDLKETDRLIWMSDMGWFIGPIQIVATTTAGATLVMAEGLPDFPERARLWRLVEKHKVSFLGITPTIARLMRRADSELKKFDLSSLRLAASTGEPWDEDTWTWMLRSVLKGARPLLNYAGGTEVGGIVGTNILFPIKPASFNCSIIGTGADVVDESGASLGGGKVGELVMREACIGLTKSLWQDDARYLDSYWSRFPETWVHGDWASRDEDGFWHIHGRSDDTIKIAGKRTGPAEIEDHLLSTQLISEAAAVPIDDEIKGSSLVCVVVPVDERSADLVLAKKLAAAVANGLGTAFRPAGIVYVSELPKTRNMKVMRRAVRAAITGGNVGDVSALYNPAAIEELKRAIIHRI